MLFNAVFVCYITLIVFTQHYRALRHINICRFRPYCNYYLAILVALSKSNYATKDCRASKSIIYVVNIVTTTTCYFLCLVHLRTIRSTCFTCLIINSYHGQQGDLLQGYVGRTILFFILFIPARPLSPRLIT